MTILRLCVVAGVAMLLAACSGKPEAKKTGQSAVPVLASKVAEKSVPVQLSAIGSVWSYSRVAIKPQVDGQLRSVHFTEGQDVKRGQLLFSIDPRPFLGSLNHAKADLARDEAQLENARIEEKRYRELIQKDIAARQTYDRARSTMGALEGSVLGDRAAVSNATLHVEWTTIHSPLDGRTGNVLVHEGNVVKAQDSELVVIYQIHPIYVQFSVPEQELPRIKKQMSLGPLAVEATPRGHVGAPVRGTLTFVDNAVDRTTGTIQLKATFANDDSALWPGQFADVKLTLETLPHAEVVPSQAIQYSQQGSFVYVVKTDMSVEARPVIVASTYDGIAVIQQGLKPGETVVTDGQLRLVPGAKVKIKTSVTADEAP